MLTRETGQEIMANVRQEYAINAALEHVTDAINGVKNRMPIDGIAVDAWEQYRGLKN